jgi:aspartate aminotransferase-like enzyme
VNQDQTNLRIPGPTPLPDEVREAGARQMINHRGPEFAALLERITSGVQPWFGTSRDVVLLSAAGTGGLEAAIVNTLSPGDRALAVTIGAFGDRFASIAATYGARVDRFEVEWGLAADPDAVREALRAGPPDAWRAVLLTHNETSTGVANDIAALSRAIHETAPDALVIVDGISAVGAVPFSMDEWGVDVLVSGSQKAWMAAPGMSLVSLSDRAWLATERALMPRFYLDLARHRADAAEGQTPWTPSVAVMYQLDAGLTLMEREGREAVFARHIACAEAARAGLAEAGLDLLAEQTHASRTVTAAWLPAGTDPKAFSAALRSRGVVVAGGQGKLKGRILRIGHLGWVTVEDVEMAVAAIAEVSRSGSATSVAAGA